MENKNDVAITPKGVPFKAVGGHRCPMPRKRRAELASSSREGHTGRSQCESTDTHVAGMPAVLFEPLGGTCQNKPVITCKLHTSHLWCGPLRAYHTLPSNTQVIICGRSPLGSIKRLPPCHFPLPRALPVMGWVLVRLCFPQALRADRLGTFRYSIDAGASDTGNYLNS